MAGWRTVAKNEIRLWTTKFRKNRKLFFYCIALIAVIFNVILLIVNDLLGVSFREADLLKKLFFSFVIIPQITNDPAQIRLFQGLFLNANIFSSIVIQLIPPIMEIICFFIFFMSFTYPIQTSLQQLNISHFEIILSSPISAKDMMLGNFLGRVPIYAIADFFVVPVFWAILSMFIPVSLFTYIALTIVILSLFIVGTFLGTITSSYLSLKLGQSKGGSEKAKAYILLIGIIAGVPIITLSMFPYVFIDPNVQYILKFIPMTWFGDIINFTILPGFIPVSILFLFIGLATLFTAGVFFLGYRYGDRFYSLELGTQVETISIVEEKSLYKFLRRLFGPLFVT